MPEPRVTVIPPVGRDEQLRLMGGRQGAITAKHRAGLAIAKSQSGRIQLTHADGRKRRRRKSQAERAAAQAAEDQRFTYVMKNGRFQRPKPR